MEKRIKRKKIYSGRIVNLVRDTVKINKKTTIREVLVHPGSAVIIPVLNKKKKEIILIKQYRYAAGKYLYELPAGTLEPGEPPRKCALRELVEETGYKAGRLKKAAVIYPSPGIITETMHVFKAAGLKKSKAAPEFDENIKTFITTLPEAIKMIKKGKISDAKTIAGILLLKEII